MPVQVGVLALQGAFSLHVEVFDRLGVVTTQVRTADDLEHVDALVVPGGESTTMSKLLEANDLFDPIAERLRGGMPTLGTCAGMILLAEDIIDGRDDQRCFRAVDIDVRRNAFGRQVDSFETDIRVAGLDEAPVHAVFIRAPVVERVGPDVEVLASLKGQPVACRQGPVLVTAFHPELSPDMRLHEFFVRGVVAA